MQRRAAPVCVCACECIVRRASRVSVWCQRIALRAAFARPSPAARGGVGRLGPGRGRCGRRLRRPGGVRACCVLVERAPPRRDRPCVAAPRGPAARSVMCASRTHRTAEKYELCIMSRLGAVGGRFRILQSGPRRRRRRPFSKKSPCFLASFWPFRLLHRQPVCSPWRGVADGGAGRGDSADGHLAACQSPDSYQPGLAWVPPRPLPLCQIRGRVATDGGGGVPRCLLVARRARRRGPR